MKYYVLKDGKPVPLEDPIEWAKFMQRTDRIVKRTQLPNDTRVSTVFLGIDHNFFPSGEPVLWETLVFGGPHDGEMERYTSEKAALEGHEAMVRRVDEWRG